MHASGLLASASLALLASTVGCSSSAPAPEPTASTNQDVSAGVDPYVTVRSDMRECRLDLSGTGLDGDDIARALAALPMLVLRGRYASPEVPAGISEFLATDVWHGMPDVRAHVLDGYYSIAAPTCPPFVMCPPERANLLNTSVRFGVRTVDLDPATRSWVDVKWLASRVTRHGALIAASWADGAPPTGANGECQTLRSSQVYVHLPDVVGPCEARPERECREGTSPWFERTEDRCLVQMGCVKPGICPQFMPSCEPGYTLASWMGSEGCARYACDPRFAVK
jgi:hypothetical protein